MPTVFGVLESESMAERCAALGRALEAEDGAETAADAIEELAGRGSEAGRSLARRATVLALDDNSRVIGFTPGLQLFGVQPICEMNPALTCPPE